MEDSGTILAHISTLKEMLDQVNEEIEANIQVTREIESSIVKCEEIEGDLATREAELIKTSGMLQFDTVGYVTVSADFRASVSTLEKELCCLKMMRDEIVNKMDGERENFTALCLEFQREIDKGADCEMRTLFSEKDSLENEIEFLDKKNNVLKNSVLAFVEEILEDLHSSNSALEVEIQRRNWENEKLLKDINDLKITLLSAIGTTDVLLRQIEAATVSRIQEHQAPAVAPLKLAGLNFKELQLGPPKRVSLLNYLFLVEYELYSQQDLYGDAAFHVWTQLAPKDYITSHGGCGHWPEECLTSFVPEKRLPHIIF